MTIDIDSFFAKFGRLVKAVKDILTASGSTLDTATTNSIGQFNSDTLKVKSAIDGLIASQRSLQSSVRGSLPAMLKTPSAAMLYALVDADRAVSGGNNEKLKEFISQMRSTSETVDSSTVSATVTAGGSNVGDGTCIVSTKNVQGYSQELAFDEDMIAKVTSTINGSTTFTLLGEDFVGEFDYNYPKGSGFSSSFLTVNPLSSSNLITNPIFSDADASITTAPNGWIPTDADATGSLTSVETQTVTISGTPTSGGYILKWTNASSQVQSTAPLAYNASQDDVQAALRLLVGLESVTVVTTGTSPDYTHTITMTGVPNPGNIAIDSFLDTGLILQAIGTAGSSYVVNGSRSLKITGNGSEQTSYHIPVELEANKQYAFCFLIQQVSITTGVLEVSLRDGIDGTVLTDYVGTSNSANVTLSGIGSGWYKFTGTFRTPPTLSQTTQYYLRFKCTTAISNTHVLYVDSAILAEMSPTYAGGPSVLFVDGSVPWKVDDKLTLAIANNYAGELHLWFERVFGIRSQGLLLPTAATGTEPDSLIT